MLKLLSVNYILTVAISSWVIAQVIKALINYCQTKVFKAERLFGAGGMPSSHSALVCSMVIAMARKIGVAAPLFGLSFVLAAVVMYDAMGVRRSAGEQAKVINEMMDNWLDDEPYIEENVEQRKKLKEFVGHTPLEVLSGALLGILVAMLIPVS